MQIECESHIGDLADKKSQARLHRGQNRLTHAIDCASDFLNAAASSGYGLRSTTNQLIQMLDDYGSVLLNEAMQEALSRSVAHPNAVRQSLQRLVDEKKQPPPIKPIMSLDKRVNELVVKTHDLSQYDTLNQMSYSEEVQDD